LPQHLTRALLLTAILLVELLAVTNWLDGAELIGRPGLAGQLGARGAYALRWAVGFSAAFAAFAGLRGKRTPTAAGPLEWAWLLAHPVLAAGFAVAGAALYGNWPGVSHPDLLVAAWIVLGVLAGASLCLGFYRAAFWAEILRVPAPVWAAATGVASLGVALVVWSQSLWESAAALTFQMVQVLLHPMVPDLIVDVGRRRLQGRHFGVIISQECSGLEGAGLMLVFGAAWLWLYRAEFRFPRALVLIPAGVVTLFGLNAVRIAALLLIGDAGAERIAAGGFHSQAGWIAFNGVALGMTVLAPRLRWFSRNPLARVREDGGENPTAAFLVPFLAILAAGMFSRAASADFEWLYGLRLAAVVGTLWMYRGQLWALDWRFGGKAVLIGIGVFSLWLGFDRWQQIPATAMPGALAAEEGAVRWLWIALRAAAAVLTVPIAEELAFRGYGMRRLMREEFESLPLREVSWAALLGSSVLFGLLHGDRWPAGIVAGIAFGWVAQRSNRMGDAVAAHAVANALLAVWVLYSDQWQYW
jgi:exosortase E/protease (VPEID-CTERM system)